MTKVLVSLDDALLRRIDRAATGSGENRSAYLARIAEAELASERGPGATEPARGALRALDDLPFAERDGDTTALIREMRDSAR